jgi:hypothetical protein
MLSSASKLRVIDVPFGIAVPVTFPSASKLKLVVLAFQSVTASHRPAASYPRVTT